MSARQAQPRPESSTTSKVYYDWHVDRKLKRMSAKFSNNNPGMIVLPCGQVEWQVQARLVPTTPTIRITEQRVQLVGPTVANCEDVQRCPITNDFEFLSPLLYRHLGDGNAKPNFDD